LLNNSVLNDHVVNDRAVDNEIVNDRIADEPAVSEPAADNSVMEPGSSIPAGMGRLLGIDLGERRVGLALCDPTRTIASPLGTLTRRVGKRPPWPELMRIVEEKEVTGAVIGLPLNLAGEDTDWTREVRSFAADFARRSGLPTCLIDERMTSVMAERAVRGSGLRRSEREQKERIDEAAAAIILGAFLARERMSRAEG
jgi:putative Holliday junction resolvase